MSNSSKHFAFLLLLLLVFCPWISKGVDEDEEIILQQRVLAALAVLGGWNEIPRVGGRVRIQQPEMADTENKISVSEGII